MLEKGDDVTNQRRNKTLKGAAVALLVSVPLVVVACSDDSPTPAASDDASAALDSSKKDRFAQDPDSSSDQCIRCSFIASFITGGGGPTGGPAPGGDPCDPDSGGGGGGMQVTFCAESVSNAFITCLQSKCSDSCSFGPTAQCDAGADASADSASSADAAAPDCGACVRDKCKSEYAAC